jgi:tRNA(Ile)-lysidine synthase
MNLYLNVCAFSLHHHLLCAGDGILVAVSGGPDSLALLHLLHDLKSQFALRLEVAHVEHGIRGEEAKRDAAFVQDWAERLDVPFHCKAVDLPSLLGRAGAGNLEEMGRHERYRFFAEVAAQRNLNKIATAHTQDDQAETVLMWLLRGAGSKGLGGMAPRHVVKLDAAGSSKELTIIRPLLGIAKDELVRFLADKNLEFCLDRSNADTAYLRNWIRLELLPRLKERIDAGVSCRLVQLAEVLRDEADYFDRLARTELDDLRAEPWLGRAQLLSRPVAMQRQLLRLWINRVRGHLRGIGFDHIEALLRMISDGPPQSRLAIPGGWELIREYERVRLARLVRNSKTRCYTYPLVWNTLLAVPEAGMTIDCRRTESATSALPDNDLAAVFDLAALSQSLVFRNFRRGDRFQPLGMAGHKKVKDLFIEKKAPLSVRAVLPLLVMNGEVLWIPGYGRSEIGRIGPNTKEMLRLSLVSSVPLQVDADSAPRCDGGA